MKLSKLFSGIMADGVQAETIIAGQHTVLHKEQL